ncbi:hypothetical protein F2Q70_00016581 [Brassica cretica]|uniref:Uncharacterized protein n=1 Tax=Brassica cretica TaxID=69181 RepID=A0A8S9HVL4_BRACR|nr:hypothetical protein F2Q70_00016581 [Brassica cretica]KAF2600020.1 hypothetical protein F2Q68_00009541 [Brassica cretica]
MELRPDPRPDIRTDRSSTRSSQPSRQAKANSRARLDLDLEVSQNDRDFSLLVHFSKALIIHLFEDLGRISTLLDHPADCPDCPAFVQLLTATTPTWPDESRHQPKIHFDQI